MGARAGAERGKSRGKRDAAVDRAKQGISRAAPRFCIPLPRVSGSKLTTEQSLPCGVIMIHAALDRDARAGERAVWRVRDDSVRVALLGIRFF